MACESSRWADCQTSPFGLVLIGTVLLELLVWWLF